MNLRVPEEIKDWIYSEAAKDDRDPGYFLTKLIREKHMEKKQTIPAVEKKPKPPAVQQLDFSSWPYLVDPELMGAWLKAKKSAGGSISQIAINTVGKELHKAVALGFTVGECLEAAENNKWKGFKAEWMKKSGFDQKALTVPSQEDFTAKHTDRTWSEGL